MFDKYIPQAHGAAVMGRPRIIIVDHPLVQEQLTIVRDKGSSQTEFRKAIFSLGRYMAYEFLRTAETADVTVQTPFGRAKGKKVKGKDRMVIILVLRAAIPFVEGMYGSFPRARTGIVSAWRGKPPGFRIDMKYSRIPEIGDDVVVVADPMLATGHTLRQVAELALAGTKPKRVAFFSIIATRRGIEHVAERFPKADFYTCAIDPQLDSHGYIVPGLGDAGDRAFGAPHRRGGAVSPHAGF